MASPTSPHKTVVVGAGIAGLSAAIQLARANRDLEVEVWEASKETGGLLAPIPFCGIDCDRGSHRIHPQADPLLLELTQAEEWIERPRKGKLILNQRQIDYPPRLGRFLQNLGLRTSLDMGLGFLFRPNAFRRYLSWESDRSEQPRRDEGFEQFVRERVGNAAYQQFYRPYVEKVWGEHPSAISRTVAKQRVSTSRPWDTLLAALQRKTRKTHRTFLYPRYGMGALIQHLRDLALDLGVTLHYDRRVDATTLGDLDASAVFFSGHLSDLAPESKLDHRGLYLLHLAFPANSLPDNDTFYAPETDYWFGRVSQIEQFSPSLRAEGKQVLCVEIPEGRWGPHHNFLDHLDELRQQLQRAGILRHPAPILDSRQTFLRRVYPLYLRSWFDRWQQAMDTVASYQKVYPIGRQGLFLHCNMDHCVRISHDAVHHFLHHNHAPSWIQQLHRYLDLRVRD